MDGWGRINIVKVLARKGGKFGFRTGKEPLAVLPAFIRLSEKGGWVEKMR